MESPFLEKLKDKHITRQTLKSVATSKVILALGIMVIGATSEIYSAPINIGLGFDQKVNVLVNFPMVGMDKFVN